MINVLIVEDDPMVAEFNQHYLEQVGGFQLQDIAGSVNQALEIMKYKEIDLILLDIFMPGRDGLYLLSNIRKNNARADVIVVSAATDRHSINKVLQYGVVDYLIKPFKFQRFRDALTAYKERVLVLKSQDRLSQSDLDKQIFYKVSSNNKTEELPKGICRDTLKEVWDQIRETGGEPFNTGEMAQRVGVSRVSMRKYIIFLRDLGILRTETIYGSVGRPVCKLRYVPSNSKVLFSYFEV